MRPASPERKRARRAFTIVELLVVMVVIVLLIGLGVGINSTGIESQRLVSDADITVDAFSDVTLLGSLTGNDVTITAAGTPCISGKLLFVRPKR